MESDKDLAASLVDAIEVVYLQNLVLRGMLMMYAKQAPMLLVDWEHLFADLQTEPKFVENIRQKFAPLRQQLAEDEKLSEVIEQFLKVAPPSSEVN